MSAGHDLGVTGSMVSRLRSGDRTPDADQLLTLAKRAEVSVDYLLGLTDLPGGVGVQSYPEPAAGSAMIAEPRAERWEENMVAMQRMQTVVEEAVGELKLMKRSLSVLEGLVKVGVIQNVQPVGGSADLMPPAEREAPSVPEAKRQHS